MMNNWSEDFINEENNKLGKIKYNNNNYHTSKILTFYTEKNISKKKIAK